MDVDAEADADADSDSEDVLIASNNNNTAANNAGNAASSSSGFAPLPANAGSGVLKNEFRRVPIPPHRFSPLKRDWVQLYTPLVENLGLQVRMNQKRRCVELRVSPES